jgi:hypothetical protein
LTTLYNLFEVWQEREREIKRWRGGDGSEGHLMLKEGAALISNKISVPEISQAILHHPSGKEM